MSAASRASAWRPARRLYALPASNSVRTRPTVSRVPRFVPLRPSRSYTHSASPKSSPPTSELRNFATVLNNSHISEIQTPSFLARLKSAYAPLISSPEYIHYLDKRTLYRIIDGFTKQHDAEALDSIVGSFEGGPAALDLPALRAIFKVQCTHGSSAGAFRAFDALQSARQGQNYTALFGRLAQDADFTRINLLFDDYMIRDKVEPVPMFFTVILSQLPEVPPNSTPDPRRLAVVAGARQLLARLESLKDKIPINDYIFTALMKWSCGAVIDSLALETFKNHHNSPPLGVSAVEKLLVVLNATKNHFATEEVYNYVKTHKIKLTEYTSLTLLRIFARAGAQRQAQAVLTDMAEAGLQPNQLHFTILISMYTRYGDMEGAQAMIEAMKSAKGAAPAASTYRALLQYHREAKDLKSVIDTYKEAQENGEDSDRVLMGYLQALLICRAPRATIAAAIDRAGVRGVEPEEYSSDVNNSLVVYYLKEEKDLIKALKLVKAMKVRRTPQTLTVATAHALWTAALELNNDAVVDRIMKLLKEEKLYDVNLHEQVLARCLVDRKLGRFDAIYKAEEHRFGIFEAIGDLTRKREDAGSG